LSYKEVHTRQRDMGKKKDKGRGGGQGYRLKQNLSQEGKSRTKIIPLKVGGGQGRERGLGKRRILMTEG